MRGCLLHGRIIGALRTRVSWDEPFHVMRLRTPSTTAGSPWTGRWASGASSTGDSDLVYRPVTTAPARARLLVGIETWGTVETTPEA